MDRLGVGSKPDIEFILEPVGDRKKIEVKVDEQNKRVSQYLYYHGEDVCGTVSHYR